MRLLVSVRSVAEAQLVSELAVDVVDVKEPANGALGRADWKEIEAIYRAVAGRSAVSVALGELIDWGLDGSPLEQLPPVNFAKFGLAGLAGRDGWQQHWSTLADHLPAGVMPVAVAYVDYATCQAPSLEEVLAFADQAGCGVVLFDTYSKKKGGLLDHLTLESLRAWLERVHAQERLLALAGSIRIDQVKRLTEIQPDFIAVRGAVCSGGRQGTIQRERVLNLQSQMAVGQART